MSDPIDQNFLKNKIIVMKNRITVWGVIISIVALSCHSKSALTRLSCCAKENAMSTPSVPLAMETNASIYQLPGKWTDANNRSLELKDLKGKVQVVAMIFTHCGYACPRIVQDIKAIEDSLPGAVKDNVRYVLVSFDAERDDPAQLNRFSAQQGLDRRWVLLHGNAGQVRELSMLLNVRYQKLGDNNFTHSNAIFILDKMGEVRQSLDGLDPQTSIAVNTIHQLVNN
jgi:protein SCO1/2